jgi:hypothetical protein
MYSGFLRRSNSVIASIEVSEISGFGGMRGSTAAERN